VIWNNAGGAQLGTDSAVRRASARHRGRRFSARAASPLYSHDHGR
jgi:hypothetical protein